MKRLIFLILAITMLLGIIPTQSIVYASAENSSYLQAFEQINVLDDLTSADNFDISKYPYDETGEIALINFVEFGYSLSNSDNYGLFIYLYNPAKLDINTNSSSNKIQMATSYNEEGLPNDYMKFELEFLNKSSGEYEGLFYKFKIKNSASFYEKITERRYDISGIEIFVTGSNNATEYGVGGTWLFKGFSKGFGSDATQSTLEVEVNDLYTMELEIYSTFYRPNSISNLGVGHQNTVNSVYFAVDNEVLNTYGSLQKIKAEWYEYKTNPIILIQNEAVYEIMQDYLGIVITENNGVYDEDIPFSFLSGEGSSGSMTTWEYGYNGYWNNGSQTGYLSIKNSYPALHYLFYTENIDPSEYVLTGAELEEYIKTYNKSFVNGTLRLKDNNISADLFSNKVDSGRIRGYNIHEIDTNDKFDLLSYDSNHTAWEKFLEFGFWAPDTSGELKDVSPIEIVEAKDMAQTDSNIAKNLLINESDVSKFKEFYNNATANNKSVVLFRFALTDYYSIDTEIRRNGSFYDDKAYMAQQTVFLDFDVIQLTFNKEGNFIVIPVVASPIDIINDITPPLKGTNWIAIIIFAIIIILLVILLWKPVILPILKLIWNVISYPFKSKKEWF